ncbi:tetratricopeptide repeat protein [Actinomadura parmotrematis]|uniref:Tetratricopeptide repeat protein n=1 Tax=Actinomadura parmotrematis TaxID=2864039 RepID=A0ABS7G4V7_9ACTN|nr:tetratricopeptide repeat protein [Actinomadura parmotrematis]MBW8486879.1 tetratricopeptide repeat protein [Actinomadura parmotrematis]
MKISADRRLRGPYTAAGALLGPLAAEALEAHPEILSRHAAVLRALAPDAPDLPATVRPLVDRVPDAERVLVPAPRRTLRLANGAAEFVREHLARRGRPLEVTVTAYAEADAADRELLAVLRRRVDPALLRIHLVEEGPAAPALRPREHDALAARAAAGGLAGPRLGAVPYHRARGTDPLLAAAAHRYATGRCLALGCHRAVAELGAAGLALADPAADPDTWWGLVHDTATALGATGREDEAAALLHAARRGTADPVRHSTIAYTLAMLAVRHHDPARRDPAAALEWVNTAIALCAHLPDRAERAVKLGFDLNGKALVEMRRGRPAEALDLVQEAIGLAERDLPAGAQPVHRMVLLANRARLFDRLGRTGEALADWDAVIAADPAYPDYYIDRGNLRLRLGRTGDAVADYEAAMRTGPPSAEPHFNRSQARYAEGDLDGALADLDRALELEPDFLDALVNRAGLLAAAGEHEAARADCDAGLAADPGNACLLAALGQVELAEGDRGRARACFDRALEADPGLAAAWAGRAALAFESGDPEAAVRDLGRALDLGEDPALLYNRAVALRAAGRPAEARADLERAAELDPDDTDIRTALIR